MLGALGLVGCVLWTGCGGGGSTAPSRVTNLSYVRTADAPGMIQLRWTLSSDKSVLGYRLRRRAAGDTAFTTVNPALIPGTSYTDQLPNTDDTRTMTYQVVAVDVTGQTSAPSEITAIITPPTPPNGF